MDQGFTTNCPLNPVTSTSPSLPAPLLPGIATDPKHGHREPRVAKSLAWARRRDHGHPVSKHGKGIGNTENTSLIGGLYIYIYVISYHIIL